MKVSSKLIPKNLRGDYKGRKFRVEVKETFTIPADANTWCEGSRSDYRAVRLADGAQITLGSASAPWAKDREDRTVTLSPDIAIVEHTVFQGHDIGLTFY